MSYFNSIPGYTFNPQTGQYMATPETGGIKPDRRSATPLQPNHGPAPPRGPVMARRGGAPDTDQSAGGTLSGTNIRPRRNSYGDDAQKRPQGQVQPDRSPAPSQAPVIPLGMSQGGKGAPGPMPVAQTPEQTAIAQGRDPFARASGGKAPSSQGGGIGSQLQYGGGKPVR